LPRAKPLAFLMMIIGANLLISLVGRTGLEPVAR
jgi:hypothetical protein